MTITTIPLQPLTVVLTRGFEMQRKDGNPVIDRATEQVVYLAEAQVPGLLEGTFNLNDRPSEARIKVLGWAPQFVEGDIVVLGGAQVTAWYVPRERGNGAKSDITISARIVEKAPNNAMPLRRGGLPATTADKDGELVAARYWGQEFDNDGNATFIDLQFEKRGSFAVDCVAEVRCTTKLAPELIGKLVYPTDLKAFFLAPDSRDVNQRTRSSLVLSCGGLELAPTPAKSNGKQPRPEPTPTPEEQPVG